MRLAFSLFGSLYGVWLLTSRNQAYLRRAWQTLHAMQKAQAKLYSSTCALSMHKSHNFGYAFLLLFLIGFAFKPSFNFFVVASEDAKKETDRGTDDE